MVLWNCCKICKHIKNVNTGQNVLILLKLFLHLWENRDFVSVILCDETLSLSNKCKMICVQGGANNSTQVMNISLWE